MRSESSDEASVEGAMMRGMFRSTSSSSLSSTDCQCHDGDSIESDKKDSFSQLNINQEDESGDKKITTTLYLGNILIAQQSTRTEIAQRLWPSASYLASFVLDFVSAVNSSDEQVTVDKDDHPSFDISSSMGEGINENKKSKYEREEEEKKVMTREYLSNFFRSQKSNALAILELGGGVGLTGIKLATELPTNVILTDLPLAIPLLNHNIKLNEHNFIEKEKGVSAAILGWGTDDWINVMSQFHSDVTDQTYETNKESNDHRNKKRPVLILAADCVYFQELHLPLEKTLAWILSNEAEGSICLIAAVRRTKRDTSFFKNLGKKTRTNIHSLDCVCIQESIIRYKDGEEHENGSNREVMRIYAVRWQQR